MPVFFRKVRAQDMNAKTLAVALVTLAVLLSCPLRADWDGTMTYMMHYPQMPDEKNGSMVFCTDPHTVADDFYATCTWGITDIHIWACWLNDTLPTRPDETPDPAYVSFTLAIYSDAPGIPGPGAPPHLPGQKLWEKWFPPSMFKVRLWKQISPSDPLGAVTSTMWQYNFSIPLDTAFVQQEGTVYWLSVHAEPLDAASAAKFGWMTSVSPLFGGWLVGTDSPTGPWYNVSGQPNDLSFVIAGRLPGDTNGDGCVDVIDLLEFIAAFGSAPGYPNYDPACDFNGDHAVDVIDLLFMIDYFGDCGPCEP